ncbi:response regulator [Saccharibacillus sacchari]|uniref:response regulator n=1 Tax=Saccharibacillus sacchari TaxID=456493 RepID=UPI0004ACF228|nr:response regulator [Saccharibacillus sacchari]
MRKNAEYVLYIEDDRSSMLLMRHIFRKKLPELQLLEAVTMEEGIMLMDLHRPSLILMDIQLPGMDGYEGLERLRSDSNTAMIPIWAISASALNDDVQRGLDAGFRKYLKKPLAMESFVHQIRESLLAADDQ